SQDPYALRRQAQGAVAILLGLEINLSLEEYVDLALDTLAATLVLDYKKRNQVKENLCGFLIQRIRFVLQERGFEHDIIEAVLAVPFKAVAVVFKKASVLEEYLKGPILDDVIVAYNRVANLARKTAGGAIDKALFQDISEKKLYHEIKTVEEALKKTDDPALNLEQLQLLKQPIDRFFDKVMVMVDDDKMRENRLNMLVALKNLFNRLADFSKLQTP
ncbi:MAG: glycine--tRNA ligase subunit beta, partial [Clostridia bacterium]|nr:glycine--tRNA ligase subunit beta [Clostridia bacterium]